MSVNHEVYVAELRIAGSMNSLLARRLYRTDISFVFHIIKRNIICFQIFITQAAWRDGKMCGIDSAAEVSPGAGNKFFCKQDAAGFGN